ncbi:hypothetical protein BVY04_03885, partial [bacterium M21]
MEAENLETQWINDQITDLELVQPRYIQLGQVLTEVLGRITKQVAPASFVQARAKAIPSFAEKIQRKRSSYTRAVQDMTDLCGVRIITQTMPQVAAVNDLIETYFEIDWENSQNVIERLKPNEFGYTSMHYIVSLKRGVFPNELVDVEIPEEVYPDAEHPMKAEIQVRTLFEHAWADILHDLTYKSAFPVPQKWQREAARVAATLGTASQQIEEIIDGLSVYAANYGQIMSHSEVEKEI